MTRTENSTKNMYTGLIFDLIGVSKLSAQQFFGNFDKWFLAWSFN